MALVKSGKEVSLPRYDYIDGGSEHGKSVPNFDYEAEDSRSYYRSMSGKLSVLPAPATAKGAMSPDIGMDSDISEQKKKEEKKAAKQLFDKLKINMANERTFTKWLLTGMQMGAIGTFVLLTLDRNKQDTIWGVVTLAFAWSVGFGIALYGMFGYYRRRKAITSGNLNADPAIQCSLIPLIVILGLVAVVVTSLLYVGTHGVPDSKRHIAASTGLSP